MTTRRSTITALLATPLAFVRGLLAKPSPPLPSSAEILKSFDARDWAKAFVEHARQLPTLATDEEAMTGWFANALMRGYDERAHWEWLSPDPVSADKELPPHLQDLVHSFDTYLGDLGRGHFLPLEKIISLKRELEEYGFVPYLIPGRAGFDSQFVPVYSPSGSISNGIWFAFVRKHRGGNQIVSFEADPDVAKQFVARTQCGSFWKAMNEA